MDNFYIFNQKKLDACDILKFRILKHKLHEY